MEELFDVCTPEGVPTGQVVPRSQVHRQGLWHRSAHLWILDSHPPASGQTRVLLQRRHPSKQTDPGRWDIAVAGHLSAGQTPLEAIVREAQEELGLVLDPRALVSLGAASKEYLEPGFLDREWQHLFAGVWNGDPDSLTLQAEEVVDARWMALEDYRRSLFAGDEAFVARSEDWSLVARWWEGHSSL